MSIVPASSVPPQGLVNRPLAPAPQPGSPAAPLGPSIDPIKLLQKYKWILLMAVILGGALGVAAHFVLMRTAPSWRSTATFQVIPPAASVGETLRPAVSTDEMTRFMATQSRVMLTNTVLQRVVADPRVEQQAPTWARQFREFDSSRGQEVFNRAKASEDLTKILDARPIPNTFLVQLSCTYTDPLEATRIVGIVREKYLQLLDDQQRVQREDRTKVLNNSINQLNDERARLIRNRQELIERAGLDAPDAAQSKRLRLQELGTQRGAIQETVSALQSRVAQLEAERAKPAPSFGDDLEAQADREPIVLDFRQQVSALENDIATLRERGIGEDHLTMRQLRNRLNALSLNMEVARKDVLSRLFNAQLDETKKGLQTQQATLSQVSTDLESVRREVQELTNREQERNDINNRIAQVEAESGRQQAELQTILAVLELDSASRVSLLEPESVPNVPSFPRLIVLGPVGVVLLTGLVAGIIVLRELIDQRVKGPSDISLIPRARLLGWIPNAGEDPAGEGNPETAFRDRGKGIVAESFRQLRSTMSRRMAAAEHRTVLVVGAMPGSGATTVVSNLALAFASADKRVLIIDANFRRPAQHRVMGLQEAPGLADVLAQRQDLAASVQATSTPNLDLLSAGSKELRVFERLSTQVMTELLTQAKAMYDVVLVDVAPAVVAGDGIALAQRCDASLLVVRTNAEKRGLVARVKNELTEARGELLGIVVNGVRASAGGYLRGNIKAASEYAEG